MINDKIKEQFIKNGKGVSPFDLTSEQLCEIGHAPISPMKAIKLKCLDCCCGNWGEVKACTAIKCPLWPFRMGKNRWRVPMSEERRQEMSERARKQFSKEI